MGTDIRGNPMPAPQGIPAEYGGRVPDMNAKPAPKETDEHLYARQTRNATVFIAVIIGIGVAFTAVVGLWIGITLAHAVGSTSGGSGSGYSCIYNGTC